MGLTIKKGTLIGGFGLAGIFLIIFAIFIYRFVTVKRKILNLKSIRTEEALLINHNKNSS